ncbi:DsrE family protein [Marimonas arenosa]|uniref:DsrE family protein n=1 Tax=Marimonas arenosa TaxID=1795305 RepID=A0AAE3WGH0_9RHOB|nr:DsrE family protein [Marimonas arenosa]MDQ2092229.1 DsrE family protein [Marimonas arenosa]
MQLSKKWAALVAAIAMFFAAPVLAHDLPTDHETHRIAIQVSDNNPGTFQKALNNAANMSKFFLARGEDYEIEIVAYNAGLHLLRSDTSPVADRVKNFSQSVPNVTFSACGNTIKGMTKKDGKEPQLVENARVVPGGVIRLMELSDQGYFMIRP